MGCVAIKQTVHVPQVPRVIGKTSHVEGKEVADSSAAIVAPTDNCEHSAPCEDYTKARSEDESSIKADAHAHSTADEEVEISVEDEAEMWINITEDKIAKPGSVEDEANTRIEEDANGRGANETRTISEVEEDLLEVAVPWTERVASEATTICLSHFASEDGTAGMQTIDEALQLIFQGILSSCSDIEGFDDVLASSDTSKTLAHFSGAVSFLEHRTLSSNLKALDELANALSDLRSAVADCREAKGPANASLAKRQEDILTVAIEVMKTTVDVTFVDGKDFSVNGKDVSNFFEIAITDFCASEWYSFGSAIGSIVEEIAAPQRRARATLVWPFTSCAT